MLIDAARVLERRLDGALGDLVESNAAEALVFLRFLFSFFPGAVAKFLSKVGGDGLAFAVRVGGEINGIRRDGQLLQLGDDFLFAGDDDVFGFEVIVDVDAQGALGQIFDVAEGSLDGVALAQIFFDGLRLGGRFDDY